MTTQTPSPEYTYPQVAPAEQASPVPPAPRSQARLVVVLAIVGTLLVAGLMLVVVGVHNYNALPGMCRSAVVAEASDRLADARSRSAVRAANMSVSLTDITVAEPIYDGPFKATVPAKFSARASAGLFTRDDTVPLKCTATFSGTWHVNVVNEAK